MNNSSINPVISDRLEPTFPLSTDNSQSTIVLNEAPSIDPKSEEELYQEARNLLLNDGEFESSIARISANDRRLSTGSTCT